MSLEAVMLWVVVALVGNYWGFLVVETQRGLFFKPS
jgi:hypothetical protein